MKKVSELISPCSTTTQTGDSEQDREFINDLFAQLAGIFPAWRQAFEDQASVNRAKRQWLNGLAENGVTTPEKISRALKAARQSASPFLPSVGQFIEWSKSNELPEYKPLMLENPATPSRSTT